MTWEGEQREIDQEKVKRRKTRRELDEEE